MRYLETTIRCRRAAADAVGNLLMELSGSGYAVDDPLAVLENRPNWEITDLVPGDPEWVTVTGWLPETDDLEQQRLRLEAALDRLRGMGLGAIEPARFRWVEDEDWANNWKAYFKPLRLGERLVVIPSWEQHDLQPGDLPLYLDPGMAFGTGTHATTALCLRWLERLVTPGSRVIDVGTGSGILAIAAHRLGAGSVLAVDIDPVAVQVAEENIRRNGAPVEVRRATLDQVEAEEADLIVANIIASVIQEILPDVHARLKPGGRFLASGIIAEKRDAVAAAMTEAWLLPVGIREQDGWVAILAMKP
ncbi:ribosomal protein L11 methyltransferase [Symbiobacterium terraclitae]|uniref:Ribosomal protein L11 methyltransferase n=1 Tax=Symbiobacterium terraclitae TaxID=557451 RepID=A0ABS4JP93_9FIRM|nr:50S ribosomal protein L11 methyltransferase [Symbiobacterium terraclitae]MBP2017354.1 ribosomal protein L11 methyltransferase [Symbiobacterium terraclitae]